MPQGRPDKRYIKLCAVWTKWVRKQPNSGSPNGIAEQLIVDKRMTSSFCSLLHTDCWCPDEDEVYGIESLAFHNNIFTPLETL